METQLMCMHSSDDIRRVNVHDSELDRTPWMTRRSENRVWSCALRAIRGAGRRRHQASQVRRHRLPLLLVSAVLAACGQGTPVSDSIGQQTVEGKTIRIADIARFSWDTFYVFSPYTPNTAICSKLGRMMQDCLSRVPATVDEGNYLLAFSSEGRVVHVERYRRGKADFCRMSCALELTRKDAAFRVSRIETPAGPSQQLFLVAGAEN